MASIAAGELGSDRIKGFPADNTLMVILGQMQGELAHVEDVFTADTVVDEALL